MEKEKVPCPICPLDFLWEFVELDDSTVSFSCWDLLLLVANHSEQGAAEPESGNEKRL